MNGRVTNTMMHSIFMSDMQNNLTKMLNIQRQILTEKKYSKPSDNPIDVTRILSLNTSVTENEQYIKNMDDALTVLKNTDNALNQMTNLYQRIRELSIYAGDGALADVDMGAIAEELIQLREQMRTIANYSVEGRYLLSGLATGSEPFVVGPNGKVTYQGGTGYIQYEVEKGQTGKVSFNGLEVFPTNEKEYFLNSYEVPLDFTWTGRDEIIQIQVGSRMVKVRIPEQWPDELNDNTQDPTDFNKFRDPLEVATYTLDDIAKLMNESMDMGVVGRLVSVNVVKDLNRNVQYLQITSHTGEPVRITTWPETDKVAMSERVEGLKFDPLINPFEPPADGAIKIRFDNNPDVVLSVDVTQYFPGPPPTGDTLQSIADKLMTLPGIWATVRTDTGGKEYLDIVSDIPGETFSLEATGGAREIFGAVDPVTDEPQTISGKSVPVQKNTDHSHIDLAAFLGIETTLKTVELPAGKTWDTVNDPIHLKIVSGYKKAEIYIADLPNLTLEELAKRINSTANGWLEAIVETDTADPSGDMSGLNAEGATQRLVLRTVNGDPLVIYDGDKAGINGKIAWELGINTAMQGGGTVNYPSGGNFDSSIPAIVEVTVGNDTYRVRLCEKTAKTPLDIAKEIVSQVNAQSGKKLLDWDDTGKNTFALLSLTGQPLRIADKGYGDPDYATYTGGIAAQLGIQSGITSNLTTSVKAAANGTVRISSMGKTVDVSVLQNETPKQFADRLRSLTGDWLDVSYYSQDMANSPIGNISLSLSAKDGSPLTIIDVTGNAASDFKLNTDLRSNDMSGYNVASGEKISIKVNGVTHEIDLTDLFNSFAAKVPPAKAKIEDVAAFINSRFQAKDVVAQVLTDGPTKTLSLSSPWGFIVDIEGAPSVMGYPGTNITTKTYAYDAAQVPPVYAPMGLNGILTLSDGVAPPIPIPLVFGNTVAELAGALGPNFTATLTDIMDSNSVVIGNYLTITSATGNKITASFAPNAGSSEPGLVTTGIDASPARGGAQTTGAEYNQRVQVRTAATTDDTNFFGVLDALISAVQNEDRLGISRSLLGKITKWGDNLLRVRAQEGSLENRYTMSKSRLETNNLNMVELRSNIGDVNLADAATQLQMAMAVYQASLAITAKIIQPTLVDFLR